MRILVLFAHPAFEKSRVNRALAEAVRSLPGVTFHDLYEAYPDFDVDVRREQSLLLEHDLLVAQHPFYWYSTPALVKQWQDLVLEHGWAYGTGGTRLQTIGRISGPPPGGSSLRRTSRPFSDVTPGVLEGSGTEGSFGLLSVRDHLELHGG